MGLWKHALKLGGAAAVAAALATVAVAPASAEEIKIGVPLSLTGPVAFAGTKMRDAMELAFEEVNKSGFLGSITLVPVWADDRSSQPQAIAVTQQLALRDQVSAIVGYTASNMCQAALPVAQDLKVPALQADCVVPGLNEIGEYVYSAVRPSDIYMEQTIDRLVPARNIKTAATLYQRENPAVVHLEPIVAAAFERNGVKMVATEAMTSGADADFTAQLTRIAEAKPDVVSILMLGGQVGPAMVQARKAGLDNVVFLGEQNFDSAEVRRVAGPAVENAVFPSHWSASSTLPANIEYVEAFRAKYGAEPDTFSANGYNAVWMMAQIVKKAGSGDREAIREAMETIGEMDTIFGSEGKTRFEDRQVVLTPFFFQYAADGSLSEFK